MSRVTKTVEPPEADGRSSKDVGRQLRQVRRKQGLSRAEVARSAGLTRRELAAYERGRILIPESDLWCLAGSCGVDVNELLPDRTPLRIGSGLSSLAMGDSIRRLREPGQPSGLLREYLSMIYELRNLPPGSRIPLRESDLATLADALGGTPDVIEERLVELVGASHEEAARLRAMILPPLSLSSGLPSSTDPYAAYGTPDEHSPVVDFFSTPRAQDPFSTQLPSLEASAPPVGAPAPDLPVPDLLAPDLPAPDHLQGPVLQPPPGTTLGTDPISSIPHDPFAVPGAPTRAFGEGANPFDPGTPFLRDAPPFAQPLEQTAVDGTQLDPAPFDAAPLDPAPLDPAPFDPAPFDPAPFDPVAFDPAPLDPAPSVPPPPEPDPFAMSPFDTEATGNGTGDDVSEAMLDPFSMPMPALRPDPFGIEPTTNGHDGIDGFVVDVPEGPLAEMSTSTDEARLDPPRPEDAPTNGRRDPHALEIEADDGAPTDWVGLRDAAAVADAPPEVVLGDGWGAPATDETATDLPTTDTPTEHPLPELVETDDSSPTARTTDLPLTEPPEPDTLALDALTPDALIPTPPSSDLPDAAEGPASGLAVSVEPDPAPDAAPIVWHAEQAMAPGPVAPELLVPAGAGKFLAAGTGWQVGGLFPATTMADDGALALRRADTRWALSDLDAPGDFTVQAVVDYRAGTGFGILFRAGVDAHERVTGCSFDVDPITGGGSYLVRHWDDNRAHWHPIAQATMTDPSELYGRHQITLTVQGDRLGVFVDGENVLTVPALSRASIELGREPCRGGALGVHAGATTELTVETFRAAQH